MELTKIIEETKEIIRFIIPNLIIQKQAQNVIRMQMKELLKNGEVSIFGYSIEEATDIRTKTEELIDFSSRKLSINIEKIGNREKKYETLLQKQIRNPLSCRLLRYIT